MLLRGRVEERLGGRGGSSTLKTFRIVFTPKKVWPPEVRGRKKGERGFYLESFKVELFGEFSPQVMWDFIRRVQLQLRH